MAEVITAQTNRLHMLRGDSGEEETTSSPVEIEEEEENDDEEEEDQEETNSARLSSGQSPRYESFVMTGEKILRLNPKISPNYAKIKHSELPKHTEILDSPPLPKHRGPFADLNNKCSSPVTKPVKMKGKYQHNQHSVAILRTLNDCKMPGSQSENVLTQQNGHATIVGVNGTSNSKSKFDAEHDHKMNDGSIITVHGTFRASETDTARSSSHNFQSDSLPFGGRYVPELPSPISPVFLSEPVTPAKYAFSSVAPNQRKTSNNETSEKSHGNHLENGHSNNDNNALLIHVSTTSSGDFQTVNGLRGASASSSSPSCSFSSSVPLKDKQKQSESREFNKSQNARQPATLVKDFDADAAKRLAKRLYNLDGFNKSDVAKHLAKK